jgi:hypothetical protein
MQRKQDTYYNEQNREQRNTTGNDSAEPLGLSLALELRNVNGVGNNVLRILEDCQGVFVLLVYTHKQRATGRFEAR